MSRVIRRGREAEVCDGSFFDRAYIKEIGDMYTSWLEAADVRAKVTQCRDGSDPRHNVNETTWVFYIYKTFIHRNHLLNIWSFKILQTTLMKLILGSRTR